MLTLLIIYAGKGTVKERLKMILVCLFFNLCLIVPHLWSKLKKMKKDISNWVGCSRWTNSSKNMAVHISYDGGNPICGKVYKGGTLRNESFNIHEVTCKKCLTKHKKDETTI